MKKWDKTLREDRYHNDRNNPSFSSTLLDEIYRSIEDGEKRSGELRYRETMAKKQSKPNGRSHRAIEEGEREMGNYRPDSLIDKWMEKQVNEKVNTQRRQYVKEFGRKSLNDREQDSLFFSSTSISSDSSLGGFSSSDSESLFGSKSMASSYFTPRLPKPVRTSISSRSEKIKSRQSNMFYDQRESEFHMFDEYRCKSIKQKNSNHEEDLIIKSKSRALKIYTNLKKVKQPISPGGRLTTFLNSLFTTNNAKKTKTPAMKEIHEEVSVEKTGSASTCSSASSFSRSCLSKLSPSSREKLRNGVKRSVHFYPVSVIVDEDCRPCGHKCLFEEDDSTLMHVSIPTAWKIGRSPTLKTASELTRRVEEVGREYQKDYNQTQKKNDLNNMDIHRNDNEYEEDEDDDTASYSSSDLFELDHITVMGHQQRYYEELRVYETTHLDTNRAIACGLLR